MIFPLSILLVFGTLIGVPFLCVNHNIHIVWSILIGIGSAIVMIAIFCLITMLFLIILGKKFAKTYNPLGKVRWFFMRDVARFSCFWLGVNRHVYGLEKIPTDTPIVIYSNHQSYLDMFIFYLAFKKFPHATMYKQVIATYPLASGMAKALGGIPIDREDDRKALEVIIQIIKEVKKGVSFLVFPEGTRTKDTYLNPYKPGSFKIAQKAGVPAVIVIIDGTYRKRMTFPFIPTNIYIKVVDVIKPEEMKELTTVELAERAEKAAQVDLAAARQKYHYLKTPKRFRK